MSSVRRFSIVSILSGIARLVLTLGFAATAFFAGFSFWVGYINRTIPGAWVPLTLPVLAMPILLRAWFATDRVFSRHVRKTGLLSH